MTQIEVVTAAHTREQTWRQRLPLLIDRGVAITEGDVPPRIVFAAITTRDPPVLADGKEHLAASCAELLRNLCA